MLIASLLDRLTDHEPRVSREVQPREWEQLRQHKDGVARDLTNLLNTRRNENDIPEEFERTRQSLAAYGVQDFTAAPMDREAIRRAIERSIRFFEPRLSRVQISLEPSGYFQFSFRITGMLRLDVGLQPLPYHTDLPNQSRRHPLLPGP